MGDMVDKLSKVTDPDFISKEKNMGEMVDKLSKVTDPVAALVVVAFFIFIVGIHKKS